MYVFRVGWVVERAEAEPGGRPLVTPIHTMAPGRLGSPQLPPRPPMQGSCVPTLSQAKINGIKVEQIL